MADGDAGVIPIDPCTERLLLPPNPALSGVGGGQYVLRVPSEE